MNPPAQILVVVHPGSACGSADFNLGKFEARAARDALRRGIAEWQGGVIVIDGDLSDELEHYPFLDGAMTLALARAAAAGLTSHRVMGSDPAHRDRIREFVQQGGLPARSFAYEVTGAWYHPEDGSGCVGGVMEELALLGCSAQVHWAAVKLGEYGEGDDDYNFEVTRGRDRS